MNKAKTLTGDSLLLTLGGFLAFCAERMITFTIGFLIIYETHSAALYSAYMLTSTFPTLIVPIIAGPFLDRYSKKYIICILNILFLYAPHFQNPSSHHPNEISKDLRPYLHFLD